jgi:type I restriction enzyme M protein
MKNIEEIKNQTYALIDDLKKTTTENGLAGSGNEYVVIVEIFLYKFLNDKFIYEAKKENPELANAEDFFAAIDAMSEDDYEEMCDSMLDTIILKKEHLIPFLAKRQNEDKFAELFDSTLESIASENSDIFYILNEDETRVSIMKPISDVVSGGTNKKNAFCRSLIGDVASFSFENAFEAGYDFFSTIFEYLIKDYNANGGGNYAEYYTPHAIAAIMAQLLVDPSEDVRSVTCYDPSAGTGTLVIALAHAIGEQNCTVYTQDISDKSSTMMMLNLILNSMSHSLTHVIQGNTLKHPFHKNEDGSLRKFDYIVSNPPFKLDFSDYHSDLKTDSYKGRFFAGIPNIPSKNKKGMEIYLCFFQHLLNPNNESESGYIYSVIKSPKFIAYCSQAATGTSHSQRRVSPDVLMAFKVVYEQGVVQKYGCLIEKIQKQQAELLSEIAILTKQRDELLPLLMNGQASVNYHLSDD